MPVPRAKGVFLVGFPRQALHMVGLALLLWCVSTSIAWAEGEARAREALDRGLSSYEEGDHDAAAEAFAEATDLARDTKLDPAVAKFNEANMHLAGEGHETAAEGYTEACRTTDLGLQRDAYFNRGNALMAGGVEQEVQQQLEPAIELVNEASAMYEQAMRLDPDDLDAKVNFELALKKREELEIKQQQQEQQQQQQQQDQENQDEQQQEDQENDQEQQQNQDQQEQQQDQQQQDQQQNQQDQQDQQQQEQQQDEQESSSDEQQSSDRQDEEQGEQEAEPLTTEEMTREEAEMLLDAKREEEKAAREQVRLRLGPRQDVEKDW